MAAPVVEQGPGGITYTAPAEPAPTTAMPAVTTPEPKKMDVEVTKKRPRSVFAGLLAIIGGVAAIFGGSQLDWGMGSANLDNGDLLAQVSVPGLDSSGWFAVGGGAALVLFGLLFLFGIPKQRMWALLAFVAGAIILGAVVYSVIDIQDLSERVAEQLSETNSANGRAFGVTTEPDLGIWVSGAGGIVGILASLFSKKG